MSVLFGLVSIALGLWGLWSWRAEFLFFVKGFLPLCLALAGVVAVLMGIAGLRQKSGKN